MVVLRDHPFPSITPLLQPDGMLSPNWREFFYSLWLRTGGAIDPGSAVDAHVSAVLATNGLNFDSISGILSFAPDELDHNTLLNYRAVEHRDHSAISITASFGLLGGGTIDTSFVLQAKPGLGISVDEAGINLDITSLTEVVPDGADHIAVYDASGVIHGKTTLASLLSGGVASLSTLSDVELTSPQHNDVLVFVSAVNDLVLSGDMNSGSDQILLSGDMQAGTDVLLLSGVASGLWKNIPFSSLPL